MNDSDRPEERPPTRSPADSLEHAAAGLGRLPVLDVLASVVDLARHGGSSADNLALNLYVGKLLRRARAGRPLTAAEAAIVDAAGGWQERLDLRIER